MERKGRPTGTMFAMLRLAGVSAIILLDQYNSLRLSKSYPYTH